MTLRSSNCRSIIGIMMGWPHLVQGTVPSGGRSPGMKTLVSHHPQVTIFSMSLALIAFATLPRLPSATSHQRMPAAAPAQPVALLVTLSSRRVKVENRRLAS